MFEFLFKSKASKVFLFILFIIFFQRGATLFVDFYDVDELTEVIMLNEIVYGGSPFIDGTPSRPVYSLFVYSILKLFGPGNYFALHFAVIIWIALTAYLLFLTNKEILDEKAGYLAALIYGIFISGFFEFNLAVHGEIIYNLFVILAFYFFVLYQKSNKKQYFFLFLTGFFAFVSFLTKGQTLVFIPMYFILIISFLFLKKKNLFETSLSVLFFGFGILTATLAFFVIANYYDIFESFLTTYIGGNLTYMTVGVQKVDYQAIFSKFIKQYLLVIVSHLPLWLFLIYFVAKKSILKEQKYLILLVFFIFSNMGIFMGGKRLYFHYFIQLLPSLVLINGISIIYFKEQFRNSKPIFYKTLTSLYIAAIFFYAIPSYTIAFFKHYNPKFIYNKDYTVINNHSVVARRAYKDISSWIKNNSNKEDKILQWGDCIEIYHFANRRPAIRFLWCSAFTDKYYLMKNSKEDYKFNNNYFNTLKTSPENQKWKLNNPKNIQYSIIYDIDRKKPKYIVDTSPSKFRDFTYPLEDFPILFDYIKLNYHYIDTINKMKVYKLIIK